MINKKRISLTLTVMFLSIFAWYGATNESLFSDISQVSLIALILIGFGKLISLFSNALFTKWSAEVFINKMSLKETSYLGVLSAAGNFFGPIVGGTGIRAVYLKKYHGLKYSSFTSTLIGYYIILFLITALFGLISLMILPRTEQFSLLFLFFSGLIAFLGVFAFVKLPKKEKLENVYSKNRYTKLILKVIYDIESGWKTLVNDRSLLRKLFLVAGISFFGTLLVSYVEFKAFGIESSLAAIGLYSALVQLTVLISLTPASIGIREALLVLTSVTIGLSNEQIIQIAVVDRSVHFVLLIVLFLIVRIPYVKSNLTGGKTTL